MPRISYESSDFPKHFGTDFDGISVLECSWAEIVHSAITVGRKNRLDVLRFGQYSLLEVVYRAAMVYANLQQAGDAIVKSPAYDSLDSSEKGAVSYYLGLVIAKLFAMKLLDTPWLMHLDVYQDALLPVFAPGKSRPDLVGVRNLRQWVVIESKGRTGGGNDKVLKNAKNQTRRLRRIGGQLVDIRVAMVTCFLRRHLSAAWSDPDDYDDDGFDLNVSIDDFVARYYDPIRQLISASGDRLTVLNVEYLFGVLPSPRQFFVVDIPEADLKIGLDATIYTNFGGAEDAFLRQSQIVKEDVGRTFIGKDGVLVRLGTGWSEDVMSVPPDIRPWINNV
jgi:hypothetical protein